eukprot:c26064_g1_i2 orf=112-681(-)
MQEWSCRECHSLDCQELVLKYDSLCLALMDHVETIYVLKRPGLDQFLITMGKTFEVVIFTAGTKDYADPLLNKLDTNGTISHRLFRDSCLERPDGSFVKNLSLLGRDLDNVIIVDDDYRCYRRQPENAIPIATFGELDTKDQELMDLSPALLSLSRSTNLLQSLQMFRLKLMRQHIMCHAKNMKAIKLR